MKLIKTWFICLGMISGGEYLRGELPVGERPSTVELAGEEGGRVDGTTWSSSELKGKVYTLFYVDPDEKDLNDEAAQALKKENFSREGYGSVAIINMDATWKPNFAISNALEEKQKEFPDTIYVKDMKKKIVKTWKLSDDNNNIVVFDKEGKVIFSKDGKLDKNEISTMITTIKQNM